MTLSLQEHNQVNKVQSINSNEGLPSTQDKAIGQIKTVGLARAHSPEAVSPLCATPLAAPEIPPKLSETAQKLDARYHELSLNSAPSNPDNFTGQAKDAASRLSEGKLIAAAVRLPKREDREEFCTQYELPFEKVEDQRIELELQYISSVSSFSDLLFQDAELISYIEFMDRRDTLFMFGHSLARANPTRFCSLAPHFLRKLSAHNLLELGTLLTKREDRDQFCKQCELCTVKVENAFQLAQKNKKSELRRTGDGICQGFTLALASQVVPEPTLSTESRGRFIHADYDLTNIKSKEANFKIIGERVLKSPEEYAHLIKRASRILGFERSKDLLKAMKLDATNKDGIKVVIGSLAQKQLLKVMNKSLSSNEVKQQKLSLLKLYENLKFPATREFNSKVLQRRQGFSLGNYNPELTPLDQLSQSLKKMNDAGTFWLSLNGHAMYVSLDSLTICDPNDVDLISTLPKVRSFSSTSNLIQGLVEYLNIMYRDEYKVFRLIPVIKNKKKTS